jgi:hypothetical protein
MVSVLQREAEKVMRTNHRLSATLRRLLDSRTHAERERVAQLLRAIRGEAVTLGGADGCSDIGVNIDCELGIDSPMRRAFWAEPPKFDSVDLTSFEPDIDARRQAFEQLAALNSINWSELRVRIRQTLTLEDAPTLERLVALHPAEGGVVEIIAYLQIATEDGHLIDQNDTETLLVKSERPPEHSILVTVPKVTFLTHRRNGHAK